VGAMTIMPSGAPTMGGQLVQWFFYCVLVSICAAYIAGRAVQPGAHYLSVFRFAGATAFFAYSIGLWQDSIWYKKSWSTTLEEHVRRPGLRLLTARFGWLWPR